MITKKQFSLMEYLVGEAEAVSQRKAASALSMSVGNVNKIFSELNELKYLSDGRITDAGIEALEPYKVKRAIFIAAGFGSRLVPITLNTPKPLIRVNGTRLIDASLDAVLEAGIKEIYIVRGYLSEQFDQLLYKYPMLHFIENPI